jgi:nitrogenase-associated protein
VAQVIFFQKPGCATNGRQRLRLENAGHTVEARDLLTQAWTPALLRPFFGDTPVASWFNPASPRVKSGEIAPGACGAEEALAWMVADPLLIRRPLVESAGEKCAGFDREPVLSLLAGADVSDVQGCAHEAAGTPGASCPAPEISGSER